MYAYVCAHMQIKDENMVANACNRNCLVVPTT